MGELVLQFDWRADEWKRRNTLGNGGDFLDTRKLLQLHASNPNAGPMPSIRPKD